MNSTSGVAYLLDCALQQIAAESYLDGVVLPSGQVDESLLKVRLRYGANNYTNLSFAPSAPNLPGKTRMTEPQIDRFVQRFEVVDHRGNDDPRFAATDVGNGNAYNGSGLSATLLRDRVSGALTLSIRSTEFADTAAGGDWDRDGVSGADGQMARLGFSWAQLAALEQYYEYLKSSVPIPAGTAINVTGYSLGAHLATAFTAMHGSEVAQTVTFNGPGIGSITQGGTLSDAVARYRAVLADPALAGDPVGDSAAQELRTRAMGRVGQPLPADNLYGDARASWAEYVMRTEFAPNFNAFGQVDAGLGAKIVQIVGHAAHNDEEYVANSGIHAPETRVFIEDQPNVSGLGVDFLGKLIGLKNNDFGTTHSITLIADALAVMDTLQRLDPQLSLNRMYELLAGSSNERGAGLLGTAGVAESDSLEQVVQALRRLYTGDASALPVDPQGGGFGNRENRNRFYEALNAVNGALAERGDRLVPLATSADGQNDLTSTAVLAKTEAGIAARYALLALQPFMVENADTARLSSLYEQHGANDALRLANPGLGVEGMTAQFIDDRAALLQRVLYYNRQDQPYTQSGEPIASDPYGQEDIVWSDAQRAINLQRGPLTAATRYVRFGGSTGDALQGAGRDDALYGMGGDDSLDGYGGNDYLEGGRGLDTLSGGTGRDWVLGGEGTDIYKFSAGDGHDVVRDKDGGRIEWSGPSIGPARRVAPGVDVWESGVDGHRLTLIGQTESTRGTLLIQRLAAGVPVAGDSIRIEAFDVSTALAAWGLVLQEPAAISPPTIATSGDPIEGDRKPLDIDPVAPGEQRGNDDWWNLRTEPTPEPDRRDDLYDRPGNDLIDGKGGDDYINAFRGGADILLGGAGNDVVLGGSGGDLLDGEADNDRLNGDGDNDFIRGGEGSDYIGGGSGNDVIYAGAGHDTVLAGRQSAGGSNRSPGPGPSSAQGSDWAISDVMQYDSNGRLRFVDRYVTMGTETAPFLTGSDDDVVYGEAGRDMILGDTGSDLLSGGADDDMVFGMHGSDIVDGGTGNDDLYGDGFPFSQVASEAGGYGRMPDNQHGNDLLIGGDGVVPIAVEP